MLIDFREKRREGRREGEGERERYIDVRNINGLSLALNVTKDWTHNLGMCPNWESNLQSFGAWMTFQPTEPPIQGCSNFLCQ